MQATFRTGPIGTGVYIVGHDDSWSDPQDVEVWFLLLFLPLVPLSLWRVAAADGTAGQTDGETLDLTIHSRSHVAVRATLRRMATAAGVATLTLLPLALAVWQIGTPWATPLLTAFLGSILSPSVLGKVSMAIELGVPLAGAAIPVLVLMHLDERTPRVPFGAAMGFRK